MSNTRITATWRRYVQPAIALLTLVLFSFSVAAQSPQGTIVGTVLDSSGAVVSGMNNTAPTEAVGSTNVGDQDAKTEILV